MFRKFTKQLKDWDTQGKKEPLLVLGVRQVGKTWCMLEYAKERGDYFYLNLEESPEYLSAFEGSLSPGHILKIISILSGRTITERTLLILDEIQVSERAITSLKYFCEAEENYRVVAAGSLLGVKLNRFTSSFPVGKVRIVTMYPMDFEEYLIALGEQPLQELIRSSLSSFAPLPSAVHDKALDLLYDYLIVGGMPQAVSEHVASGGNIAAFHRDVHQNLYRTYVADMSKYVHSAVESVKINQVFDSIPRQLARENPTFKYRDVKPTANRRDYYAPIDWLCSSRMVFKVPRVTAPTHPLKLQQEEGTFKLYLFDVGLLSTMAGMERRDFLLSEDVRFKGFLVENYVFMEAFCRNLSPYFFRPSQKIEIDMLLDMDSLVVPMEIKAGRHKRSTSLKNYMEAYSPEIAVRISALGQGKVDKLISVPLYAVGAFLEGNVRV